jgi:hypothetical protein
MLTDIIEVCSIINVVDCHPRAAVLIFSPKDRHELSEATTACCTSDEMTGCFHVFISFERMQETFIAPTLSDVGKRVLFFA